MEQNKCSSCIVGTDIPGSALIVCLHVQNEVAFFGGEGAGGLLLTS